MADILPIYRRTVKLPCDGLESGRPFKDELDAKVRTVVTSLSSHDSQPQCKLLTSETGNLVGILTVSPLEIRVTTVFGHNTSFRSGVQESFVSYMVQVETRFPTADQAESSAETQALILKLGGGVLGPLVLFGLFTLMLKLTGRTLSPALLAVISLPAGVWCGHKLGSMAWAALKRNA